MTVILALLVGGALAAFGFLRVASTMMSDNSGAPFPWLGAAGFLIGIGIVGYEIASGIIALL